MTNDTELLISIPIDEYHQLQGIVYQFKELINSQTTLVEDYYKKKLAHLHWCEERCKDRDMSLRKLWAELDAAIRIIIDFSMNTHPLTRKQVESMIENEAFNPVGGK